MLLDWRRYFPGRHRSANDPAGLYGSQLEREGYW
jgi:hypothetical protein